MLRFSFGPFAPAPHLASPRSRGERDSGVTPQLHGECTIFLRDASRYLSPLAGRGRVRGRGFGSNAAKAESPY